MEGIFVNCSKWSFSCPKYVHKMMMMILILFIFVLNRSDIVCFHFVRYQFMIESYFSMLSVLLRHTISKANNHKSACKRKL